VLLLHILLLRILLLRMLLLHMQLLHMQLLHEKSTPVLRLKYYTSTTPTLHAGARSVSIWS
jgi:hypothetical protein